jgi:hypothetical protein
MKYYLQKLMLFSIITISLSINANLKTNGYDLAFGEHKLKIKSKMSQLRPHHLCNENAEVDGPGVEVIQQVTCTIPYNMGDRKVIFEFDTYKGEDKNQLGYVIKVSDPIKGSPVESPVVVELLFNKMIEADMMSEHNFRPELSNIAKNLLVEDKANVVFKIRNNLMAFGQKAFGLALLPDFIYLNPSIQFVLKGVPDLQWPYRYVIFSHLINDITLDKEPLQNGGRDTINRYTYKATLFFKTNQVILDGKERNMLYIHLTISENSAKFAEDMIEMIKKTNGVHRRVLRRS